MINKKATPKGATQNHRHFTINFYNAQYHMTDEQFVCEIEKINSIAMIGRANIKRYDKRMLSRKIVAEYEKLVNEYLGV